MAPKDKITNPPKTGAGPDTSAPADATGGTPEWEKQGFKSERDYIQARAKQAREEQFPQPKEGTPGGPPAFETLEGAAEDRAGYGKPIGSGNEFTRGQAPTPTPPRSTDR